jgi:Fe-Mn family superoxide dismutase
MGVAYSLPQLSYAYDALEPQVTRELLELHHTAHHAAYVKGANETLEKLADARGAKRFEHIGQLEKNLAFNVSGHVLHSLLWKNLAPGGAPQPERELAAALMRDFGSIESFQEQLTAAAMTVQGSGWAALSWEPAGRHLVVEQVYDHQGNTGNATLPILAADMWEHAYYLQYRNQKAAWIKAFWQRVNWTDVAERLAKVNRTDLGL